MIVVAVLAAMTAAWLGVTGASSGARRFQVAGPARRRAHHRWRASVVACGAACVVGVFSPVAAVIAAVGSAGVAVVWMVMSRLRQKAVLRRVKQVVRAAQVTESLLALGHIPAMALTIASQECSVLKPVVAAVQMGGEPWEVLEELSQVPGQAGLAEIGQGWRIAQMTGASMHESLTRIRQNLEESADLATTVAGELAGPKMTGQMLAVLPLLGLVMASFIGVDAFQFFTSGLLGRCCLMAGVGLVCLGVVWTEVLVRRADTAQPVEVVS